MKRSLQRFLSEEGGATAVEYGVIAALVILVALGAFYNLGTNTTAMWNNVASHI